MDKKKVKSDLEYKKRISSYHDKPLYIRIKEKYPKKTDSEIMGMFFEYQKEESYYFKDMILLMESYEMIGKVLEHEKVRRDAFIAKMISFLFYSFAGFLLFKVKKEAEDIREKYLKISIEEGSDMVKETFYSLCDFFGVSALADQVFQFISISDSELQKMYRADTSVQIFVKSMGAIGLESNKNSYILRMKLPPPKYITKKYGL